MKQCTISQAYYHDVHYYYYTILPYAQVLIGGELRAHTSVIPALSVNDRDNIVRL